MKETLFEVLIKNTGLPEDILRKDLETLLSARGLKEADLTMNDIREILVEYLQETIIFAKENIKNCGP